MNDIWAGTPKRIKVMGSRIEELERENERLQRIIARQGGLIEGLEAQLEAYIKEYSCTP